MNTLIYGLSFGDEGKGRVVSYFVNQYDWVVRFSGGANAGHTVYKDYKKHKLHQLPSGVLFGKKVALDSGMVVDFDKLIKECEENNIDLSTIYMSNNVHLIQPSHLEKDAGGSGIGTTKSGIGPVYADRAARTGIRAHSLQYSSKYQILPQMYDGLPPFKKDENILYESAQGIMLDIDYGRYPYVTSSSIGPSCWHKIDKKIAVFKAYVTRVGDGPPNQEDIPMLRELGQEYGTTTGRPRKCHWLNVQDLDYAISVTRPDEIFITKMDILKDIPDIKVHDNGEDRVIGNLDIYKEFLLNKYPQIKYISYAPQGDVEVIK